MYPRHPEPRARAASTLVPAQVRQGADHLLYDPLPVGILLHLSDLRAGTLQVQAADFARAASAGSDVAGAAAWRTRPIPGTRAVLGD